MHKLMGGVFAALIFAAACGTTGPGGSGSINIPTGVGDAKTQLCAATGDASLAGLAAKLDGFDPSTMDTADFQVAAAAVAANLALLNVSGDQAVLRDAAVTAIQSVQGTQVDATTAKQAASAIRALDEGVC